MKLMKVMQVLQDLLGILNEKTEIIRREYDRRSQTFAVKNFRKIFVHFRPMYKSIFYSPSFFLVYYILLVISIPLLYHLLKFLAYVRNYIWTKIKQFFSTK